MRQQFTGTILGGSFGFGCFFQSSRRAWCWRVRLSGLPSYSEARKQPHVEAETGSIIIRQSTEAFEEFPFLILLLALFALGNMVHYFFMALYLAVVCPVFGCCLWSTVNWILWVMRWCSRVHCLARFWQHVPSECCLRNTVLDLSEDSLVIAAMLGFMNDFRTFCTWLWTRILKFSLSILVQNGEVCSADVSVFWSSS